MDLFKYINGHLHIENVTAESIVQAYGSPVYVYSANTLRDHYHAIKTAFSEVEPLICFSVKSCSNLSVLRVLVEQGSGLDVVSGGELFRSLKAGVEAEKIVFAGVGKSRQEIREGILAGVGYFNAESIGELRRLDDIAAQVDRRVSVAIRINPDVIDPSTPEKTSTGGRHTKFGIPIDQLDSLFTSYDFRNIDITGLHVHLGSPIPATQTYLTAIDKIENAIHRIEKVGGRIDTINLGGGFPAQYCSGTDSPCSIADMGAAICNRLRGLKARGKRFIIEPGRSISANSAILLTSVEYLKEGWDRRIAVIDAGMNVLLRPSMYGARHELWPIRDGSFSGHWSELAQRSQTEMTDLQVVDVVGPICETGDHFAINRHLPELKGDDILAVYSCGAYAMSMASQYNSRQRPAEIIVDGDRVRVIRQREQYHDLVAHELCGLQLNS